MDERVTRPMPSPLLRPTAPRAQEKPSARDRGPLPPPTGAGRRPPGAGRKSRLGCRPTPARAGASSNASGSSLPPRLLATARSVVDIPGSWGAGLSPSLVSRAMAEVEETLKRIQSHKGVIGTMVVNAEGLLHQLTMKARSTVRDIDPQNDLTFLRIRSKKHEIMVAPDKEYLLIAIQNPGVFSERPSCPAQGSTGAYTKVPTTPRQANSGE
ncbi:LOW QUALITY PROTEIN: hypothetical protein MC885_005839, partial [Smutsia gigantea]